MNTVLSIFSKLDTFSVPFTLTIGCNNQNVFYKSAFGGMISLIIFTFALIYSVDQLYTWGTGNMVYKVSSQIKNGYDEESDSFKIQNKNVEYQNYIEFYILSNDDDVISPFQQDQAILLPLLVNIFTLEFEQLLENYNEEDDILEVNFVTNDINVLIFVSCIGNEQYLHFNQKCANQTLVDYFFNQKGLEVNAQIFSDKIDYTTSQVEDIYSKITLPLDNSFSTSTEIYYEFELINIKKGILFQENEQHLLNVDFTTFSQTQTQIYLSNYVEYYIPVQKVYVALWLSNTNDYTDTQVQYPPLSEALANIASVCQTLLLIRYIINWINRDQMYTNLKSDLINMYYPEYNNIKKIKIGKQEKYFLNNVEIEKHSFIQFKNELSQLLMKKFDFINLVRELFIMQRLLFYNSTQKVLSKIKSDPTESIIQGEGNFIKLINLRDINNSKFIQTFNPFFFSEEFINVSSKKQDLISSDRKNQQFISSKISKSEEAREKVYSEPQIRF